MGEKEHRRGSTARLCGSQKCSNKFHCPSCPSKHSIFIKLMKMGCGFKGQVDMVLIEAVAAETKGQIKNDDQVVIHFVAAGGDMGAQNDPEDRESAGEQVQ